MKEETDSTPESSCVPESKVTPITTWPYERTRVLNHTKLKARPKGPAVTSMARFSGGKDTVLVVSVPGVTRMGPGVSPDNVLLLLLPFYRRRRPTECLNG